MNTYHVTKGNDRVVILRLLRARHAMTIEDLTRHTEYRREYLASVLRGLQSDGLISYCPDTEFYRPEDPMRFRKKTPMPITNISEAKERLVLDFYGPHGVAISTVEDDPVLSERLALAIADDLPVIDLSAIPKHRRPAVIEEQIDLWLSQTKDGPCSFCGTKTQRSSGVALGYLDATPGTGFTVRPDGTRACAWCTNFLSTHTLVEFRETIGNAIAGTMGIPVIGFYRYATPDLVPFATEVQFAGTAWGHFTKHRVEAIRVRAQQVVHPKRFCSNAEQARTVSIKDLDAPWWDPKTLVLPKKVFAPLSDIKAYKEEQERQAEARKAKPTTPGHIRRLERIEAKAKADAVIQEREAEELRAWAKQHKVI